MTQISAIEGLKARLAGALDVQATVEVAPAREAGRMNVWVVGQGAPDIVTGLIEDLPPEVQQQLNNVQVFEDDAEAMRLGVRLIDSLNERPDWLSRVRSSSQVMIDQDPSFETPLVVSFYSFRGGVGRSTALAHTASLLAQRGRRVVVIDADLEAPGIHHAFGVTPSTPRSSTPFVDLLSALERDPGCVADLDVREFLVLVEGYENLYVLPAGDADQGYLQVLDGLNIRSWGITEQNPAKTAIELVATSPLHPEIILVDARTGLTDTNAPFLLGASDHVVIVFFPSAQSRSGAELVTRALAAGPSRRGGTVGLHFVASPIPAGRGASTDAGLVERAKQWATDWTSPAEGDVQDPDFLAVPYAEALASTDRITRDPKLIEPYLAVADWLDPVDASDAAVGDLAAIREELRFTAGNSDVPGEDVRQIFVRTADADRLRNERVLLVEGRKGTGKTTLFRWLLEEDEAIAVTAPERLRSGIWWPTRDAWARLSEIDPEFRLTWPALIALRVAEEVPAVAAQVPRVSELLKVADSTGVSGLVRVVEQLAGTHEPVLTVTDLMVSSLRSLPSARRIIFDGLDTAFGYSSDDRALRDTAIGGLLPLLMDREAMLPDAIFTVFLRTDIVRGISFANQSHLFGRRLALTWDKEPYLKTVLKQALTSSPTFATHIKAVPTDVDDMTEDRTLQVWYALVGVRVRGKQTAFTDRWVWSRLADGNGDHSPRHAAQLLGVLAERARERSSEPPPPLRPRDFGTALSETVSQEALTAVRDEFATEVEQVLPIFAQLEQSPFSRYEWQAAGGDSVTLSLAETMGLVAIHPRDRDRLIVPELYRYAFSIRRRGPA